MDNDGQGTSVYNDSTKLLDDIYNFPVGVTPFIYSFGNSHQLPLVVKKPTYSDESAKSGTADLLGCIALSEFLNLDNELEYQSTIAFMDEVVHQNDPHVLSLLSCMRNGTVAEQDSTLLLSRCLDFPCTIAPHDGSLPSLAVGTQSLTLKYTPTRRPPDYSPSI